MLSQLGLVQVGDVLPLQLANRPAHQLKLLDVSATVSFTCSLHLLILYPHYIQGKHCYLASQKAMLCQESLHPTFCNVRQLAKCSECSSCTCTDISSFYQLHSSRAQCGYMGKHPIPGCTLDEGSNVVIFAYFSCFRRSCTAAL